VALKDGAVVADGTPHDVLAPELLRTVFDLEARVVVDPVAGTPLVVPVGRRHRPAYPWVSTALNGRPLPTFSDRDRPRGDRRPGARPDPGRLETVDRATYDKLSRVAPTVVQSAEYPDEQTPWDVQTLTTGKALGRAAQAQELVDTVRSRIDAARAAHPEFAGKVLVVDFGPENGAHYLLPAGDPRRALFDALGFAAQEEKEDVSDERADVLDRDVLFVNGASRETMLGSPTFSRLKAVQSDRTLYTTFETSLAYSGPNALLHALACWSPSSPRRPTETPRPRWPTSRPPEPPTRAARPTVRA
jgi:iron complex transport system substrate-binding protein